MKKSLHESVVSMKQVSAKAKVDSVKCVYVNPFPIGNAFFPKGIRVGTPAIYKRQKQGRPYLYR